MSQPITDGSRWETLRVKGRSAAMAAGALLLGLSLLVGPASSETAPTPAWAAYVDGDLHSFDYANAITTDAAGNVYVTGSADRDYVTVKYAPDGSLLWKARYDGPAHSTDNAVAVAVDLQSNVYVTGSSYGGTAGSGGTDYDITTVKYDAWGQELWVDRYDGAGGEDAGKAIAVDSTGAAVVVGAAWGAVSAWDYVTLKYSPDGKQVWTAGFDAALGADRATAVKIDGADNIYITGESAGATNSDYATLKYGPAGNRIWLRRYNGTGNGTDTANALAVSADGSSWVTGVSAGVGNADCVTVHYSPTGTQLWAARFNGAANGGDAGFAVTADADGKSYVAGTSWGGSTGYNFLTMKLNADGTLAWNAAYNGFSGADDEANALVVNSSGNVIVTGRATASATSSTYATLKYSPTGSLLWTVRTEGNAAGPAGATGISLGPDESAYVTGNVFSGSATQIDYGTLKLPAPPATPDRPSDLQATIESGKIRLGWTDNSADEVTFKIERRVGAATTWSVLASVAANTVTYLDTSVVLATEYHYRVSSVNSHGSSLPTDEISVLAPLPAAPTNLTATVIVGGKLQLDWIDNTPDEISFTLERRLGTTGTWLLLRSLAANTATYIDAPVVNTQYYYRVKAVCSYGASLPSAEVGGLVPLPSAPSDLTATFAAGKVQLSWTDNTADETSFKLERRVSTTSVWTVLTSPTANVTSYADAAVVINTRYYYRISAVCSYASSLPSAEATVLVPIPAPPAAPSDLTATVVGSKIRLNWTDNSADETAFKLERRLATVTTWSLLATLGANVTERLDTTVANNTRYYYRVTATSPYGVSAPSNEANELVPLPAAPTNLTATFVAGGKLRLDWVDNTPDETYFFLERRLGATGAWLLLKSLAANTVTYVDAPLVNTQYYYRVKAVCAYGTSLPSAEVGAVVPLPAAPTNLTVTVVPGGKLRLDWTDNTPDETSFTLERRLKTTGGWFLLKSLAANTVTYIDAPVVNTQYFYRVKAGCPYGVSLPSAEVEGRVPLPAAPSNLTVTVIPGGKLQLDWTDNTPDSTSFTLERRLGSATAWSFLKSVPSTTLTYVDGPTATTTFFVNTQYVYRVKAFCPYGASLPSAEVGGLVPRPNAPSNLTANFVSGKVQLTWADNTPDETSFKLERRPANTTIWYVIGSPAANVTSHADSAVTINTHYFYRVSAVCAYATSVPSAEASVLVPFPPPPAAPSDLTATAVGGKIRLNWTDNSTDETAFKLERRLATVTAWSLLATLGANVTERLDTTVAINTRYYYRVIATSPYGVSAPSNEANELVPLPAAPTNLTATVIAGGKLRLDWTDNTPDETSFTLERRLGKTGGWFLLKSLAANTVTYIDAPAVNTQQFYRLKAVCAYGSSLPSVEVEGRVPLPAAPTNLTVTVVPGGKLQLDWTDNTPDETSFSLERRLGSATTWALLKSLPASTVTYIDSPLVNTQYVYRVKAVCAYSASLPSAEVGGLVPRPSAPSDLTATFAGGKVQLSWTDNTPDETSFKLERRPSNTTAWAVLTSPTANVTSYADSALAVNARYYYRVTAVCAYAVSAPSAEATVMVPIPPPPASPSGLTATVAGTKIQLNWTDNSADETAFRLERRLANSTIWSLVATLGANITERLDTSVAINTRYYYRVRAANLYGASAYSNEANELVPLPAAPTNLTATVIAGGKLRLDWTDNTPDETSFTLERRIGIAGGWFLLKSLVANTVTYIESPVVNTQYFYRIKAVCSYATSLPSVEVGGLVPLPSSPTNVEATPVSGQIRVTWSDNTTDEVSFKLERRLSTVTTWSLLQSLPADTTSYLDTAVQPTKRYYYRITAVCSYASSAPSNTPSAVASVTATPTGWVRTARQMSVPWRRRREGVLARSASLPGLSKHLIA